MSSLIEGVGPGGTLLLIGATVEPLSISPAQLLGGRKRIQGRPSGTARDSEDALLFSALTGVRPMIDRYPLDKAAQACDRMLSGQARFRVVLTMGTYPTGNGS